MQRLLLLCSLIFSLNTFAQEEIHGFCADKRGKFMVGVEVNSAQSTSKLEITDHLGRFSLLFEEGTDTVEVSFSYFDDVITRTFVITQDIQNVGKVAFPFQLEAGSDVVHRVFDPFELPRIEFQDLQNLPNGGVERYLALTSVARSNNELTTNYNVRGGNFDENLVYVNGFQIYRPFLTRSGQQEGMSFIHSALVKSIQFSGGGFDARYGDKLSSVLDITYKTPKSFKGSFMASLLGVEAHVEQAVNPRFNYIVGARYRSNGYLLNSLPTKGAYNPVFYDGQILTNFAITEKLIWSNIFHFSSNNFRFIPQTSRTDFGTANEAYSFVIFFDGQEMTRFQTMMGGSSLKWKVSKKTQLDFYLTAFNTDEREYFDIQGQYFINELETDPSKEEFGDSIAVLGIGTFLDHARNRLNATIMNVYHHGEHILRAGYKDDARSQLRKNVLKWGVNAQLDDFTDRLSEWSMVDSAGYSVPQDTPSQVVLFETIKGDLALQSQRYTSWLQLNSTWSNNERDKVVRLEKAYKDSLKNKLTRVYVDTIRESPSRWTLSAGTRAGYTTVNNELFITPRAAVTYSPRAYMVKDSSIVRRNVNYRFATGLYYQPPFYRELRTFRGELRPDIKAQKSVHFVGGTDIYFNMWSREVPFKFSAEAFYKYLWDVNPYEIENVRTRYYATNDARAYAYGIDLNVNGQFVDGIESFFKVGFMSTKEDILNDYYWEFYNASGEKIIFGYSEDQEVVDSARIEPGFVPRPTDQWISFGALVQDRMPNYESFSVQVGVQYGSPLPYGPPDFNRYKDTLRLRPYFRVDIGMSYDFLYKDRGKETFWSRNFDDAILSFEVFNLLGVNNVLSKQWVQDVQGRYYSIPNYLTQRRFNLKMILRF